MKYPELKGLCKNCLGCTRLENPNFEGVYRCEYATDRQINVEDLRKELKKNEIRKYAKHNNLRR